MLTAKELPHQSVFISHISVLPRTSTLAAIGVDVCGTICVVMGTDGCGNASQSVSFSQLWQWLWSRSWQVQECVNGCLWGLFSVQRLSPTEQCASK